MLELLTRVLLWASIGLLIWYVLLRIIPRKYLTWFGGLVVLVLIVASFVDPNDDTIGIIWRMISLPLSPLGASVLLLGSALSGGVNKANGRLVSFALAILVLTSMPITSRWLVAQTEGAVAQAYAVRRGICQGVCPAIVPEEVSLAQAGAIVVFGERADVVGDDTLFRDQVGTASNSALAARLFSAAQIYRQSGNRPFVIVTAGPRSGEDQEAQKAAFIRNTLTQNGVLAEDIRLLTTQLNARNTADDVEDFLEEQGVLTPNRDDDFDDRDDPRVVLVAPALTMSRAALTFEQMGMQVIARPTDFQISDLDRSDDLLEQLPDIFPNAESLALTTRSWNEFLTKSYYFLRGWLPSFDFGWDSSIEI
ncbi:MAG: ElyC/SanA/YdcF family protein [Cyanobacteria bacterium P01_G01_bin.38]